MQEPWNTVLWTGIVVGLPIAWIGLRRALRRPDVPALAQARDRRGLRRALRYRRGQEDRQIDYIRSNAACLATTRLPTFRQLDWQL